MAAKRASKKERTADALQLVMGATEAMAKAQPPAAQPLAPAMTDRPDFIKPKAEEVAEASNKVGDMAREFRRLRDLKDEQTQALAETNKSLDKLSEELAEEMENTGVDKFSIAGVGYFRVDIINRPRVLNSEEFIAYLDETGAGGMAPRTVHWKRLESYVKELLENNQALPSSLENFQQKRAALRRS